jgi:secreted trypsin-like serine protease
MRILLAIALIATSTPAARALVGGAAAAPDPIARAVVVIAGARGFCSGVALARDLVLTAAHCVPPGAEYQIVEYDAARQPQLRDIARIIAHPNFNPAFAAAHRATADVALLKLAAPLASVAPAVLHGGGFTVAPGDQLTVAGAGVTAPGDGRSGGIVRSAPLIATGRPGTLQVRLFDAAARGERGGLGACTGDSGGPVFATAEGRPAIVGVISWATGPRNSAGCGGLTGVTPLTLYLEWIRATAKILRNQL